MNLIIWAREKREHNWANIYTPANERMFVKESLRKTLKVCLPKIMWTIISLISTPSLQRYAYRKKINDSELRRSPLASSLEAIQRIVLWINCHFECVCIEPPIFAICRAVTLCAILQAITNRVWKIKFLSSSNFEFKFKNFKNFYNNYRWGIWFAWNHRSEFVLSFWNRMANICTTPQLLTYDIQLYNCSLCSDWNICRREFSLKLSFMSRFCMAVGAYFIFRSVEYTHSRLATSNRRTSFEHVVLVVIKRITVSAWCDIIFS